MVRDLPRHRIVFALVWLGILLPSLAEAQFFGRKATDTFAVHGQLCGACVRYDFSNPFGLEFGLGLFGSFLDLLLARLLVHQQGSAENQRGNHADNQPDIVPAEQISKRPKQKK